MKVKTSKAYSEKQTKLTAWRILEIDSYLQTGKPYTAAQLAKLVGTHDNGKKEYSIRTIQRDLEYMLDTLHAPIASDYRGYRYTEPNFFIKTIPLTEGEAFSVAVLNPLLEQYRNTPIENQLRSVFKKITECLPERISVDTSFLNPKITFIPDRTENIDPSFFQTIFDSLKNCCTITFEYRPLQKTSYMERTLDPYHVVCQRGNWYVMGKCHDRNEVRIFSFSRMKNIKILEKKFGIPKDFKPSDYFDVEMGVWLSDKTPITVELLVDKEIGTYALNRIWHSEQTVEERDDGSIYVKFQTTQKREIIRWVLGQGHTVKVLGPQELVEEIKAELKSSLKRYN
ncbi:helix-turn-helix transcriptional regulator [Treponema bryantii]|uniref:helix-turn-helix transcriptional regulator n=1 Tax=Treponema bryantii TaxID=163 RepID=UPI0003B768BC|nr:WYL domain-containing protein [Treponema bryantii]